MSNDELGEIMLRPVSEMFRISQVAVAAYPDDVTLAGSLAPLGLSTQMIKDAISAFSSTTPRTEGLGYQQVVARELERFLETQLLARAGLERGSPLVSPNLNEQADLALGRPGYDRLLLAEIEFRPNFEKDLVKFMIAERSNRLAAGLLIVSLARASLNPRYTTMPEFHKVIRIVRELAPNLSLCVVGIEGAFE